MVFLFGINRFKRDGLAATDRAWLTLVDASGIQQLHDATIQRPNHALLTAFLERWSPETNSFHMPWGEMTITLHDVSQILGMLLYIINFKTI